ncbi:MAG: lytic transglycosylase domain-containing protein, partial [Campylobacteraceae bacterium]|nr:lytic transglycosylase domain-containing protein [Campylobacteraceae bacterium]
PALVTNLNSSEKLELANILENNPYTKSWVEAMAQSDVFSALKEAGGKQFLTVFNGVGWEYKSSVLNKPLSNEFIEELEPLDSFSAMLRYIVYEKPNLGNTSKSLLYTPKNSSNLTHQSAFLLGIYSLKNKKAELADKFFTIAEKNANFRSDKDKSLFWRYLTTNNETLLQEASQSFDINIYSLYAKEHFNVSTDTAFLIKVEKDEKVDFDVLDPFAWINVRKEIVDADDEKLVKLSTKYANEKTIHAYMFTLERLSKYKRSYYITPYSDLLKDSTLERQASIYAIARQESRFVPPSVSTSYALGMMQFMPFVARDIAKNANIKNFDIDDMFKPEVAYKFANIHLDYLDKYLYHPLFVAYAYNGGIGFTKKMLESGTKFREGDYEPFMSIETIANNEARDYGKKVLANYVMYSKFLGNDVSIKNLFEELTKPELTDKFRQ